MKRTARVRLVDVARASEVSVSSVSAALNGTGRIGESTRDRVREVARRLGYRPDPTARLLRAGHTKLIGLAAREYVDSPWVYAEQAYFAQLITGAVRAAHSRGYAIVLLPTLSRDDYWLDIPLDGVYIVDPIADDPMIADCVAAGIPVVADKPAPEAAVRQALDHLHRAGARDIAVIAGESTALFHQESARTCETWCAENGVSCRVARTPAPGSRSVLAAIEEMLTPPWRPDAIFTLVEASTPLVLDAIRRLGRSVPGDLLLLCTTEDASSAYTDPPVTTLSFRPADKADRAIGQLIDSPAEDLPPLAGHLHVRASTSPAR